MVTSPYQRKERMGRVNPLHDDIHGEHKIGIIENLSLVYPRWKSTVCRIVQILGEDRVDGITTLFIHRHHREHPEIST